MSKFTESEEARAQSLGYVRVPTYLPKLAFPRDGQNCRIFATGWNESSRTEVAEVWCKPALLVPYNARIAEHEAEMAEVAAHRVSIDDLIAEEQAREAQDEGEVAWNIHTTPHYEMDNGTWEPGDPEVVHEGTAHTVDEAIQAAKAAWAENDTWDLDADGYLEIDPDHPGVDLDNFMRLRISFDLVVCDPSGPSRKVGTLARKTYIKMHLDDDGEYIDPRNSQEN